MLIVKLRFFRKLHFKTFIKLYLAFVYFENDDNDKNFRIEIFGWYGRGSEFSDSNYERLIRAIFHIKYFPLSVFILDGDHFEIFFTVFL